MNLEPILRNLIESALYKCKYNANQKTWHLWYKNESITKPFYPDETIDQVVDWFYYRVLQLEQENEEA